MKKISLLLLFTCITQLAALAQNETKEDNSFKIVGIITLLGALVLALRAYKNNTRS